MVSSPLSPAPPELLPPQSIGGATISPGARRLLVALLFVSASILRWNHNFASIAITSFAEGDGAAPKLRPTEPVATVAYAVSITSCSTKLAARLFDAAAVLRRSIQLNSWPLHAESSYAAKFYAFTLKPEDGSDPAIVDRCYQILSLAGWEVIPQDPPLYPTLIKEPEGSVLKMGIHSDGCCGHLELIKLATYKLIDYNAAVHLDLDTLVVNPFDDIMDVMHLDHRTVEGKIARRRLLEVAAPTYINRRQTGNPSKPGDMDTVEMLANITVDAFFTKDYNMIVPGQQQQRVGIQGGFLVVRPSTAVYTHLINLVYSGEFYGGFNAAGTGWFKSGYGRHIWGAMTIQGLMSYFFDVEQPEHSVELNRCMFNNIADNARVSTFAKNPKFPRGTLLPFVRDPSNERYNFVDTKCRDGRESCDETDCQRFPLRRARVLHYTYCKNPWKCNHCNYLETYKETTCYEMLRKWFWVRSTLPGEGNATQKVNVKQNNRITVIREDGEVELKEGNCFEQFYLGYCTQTNVYVGMKHRNLTLVW